MIDYELSKIHGKQYIYYPLVDPLVITSEEDTNSKSDKTSSTFSPIIDPIGEVSQESSNIYEKISSVESLGCSIWVFEIG